MLAGNLKKPAKQGCYVSCFRPTPPLSNNSTLSLASPPYTSLASLACLSYFDFLEGPGTLHANLLKKRHIFLKYFFWDCDLWISQKQPKKWTTNLQTGTIEIWKQKSEIKNPHQSHRVSNFCWLMLIRNCFGKQFLFFIIEDIGLIYLLKISIFTLKN